MLADTFWDDQVHYCAYLRFLASIRSHTNTVRSQRGLVQIVKERILQPIIAYISSLQDFEEYAVYSLWTKTRITELTDVIFHLFVPLLPAVIENSVWFFFSILFYLFPIRMSFTSSYRQSDSHGISPVTQTVTSWNLLSRIRVSGLPGASFLLKSVSFFTHRCIVYSFSSRSLFFAETENISVSVDLRKVQFRGWWPKDLRSLKKTNTSRQEKCFQETIEHQTQCPNTCCYLCIICLFWS